MCKSNVTLLIQKLLNYRIIIRLFGCRDHLKFSIHFQHTAPGGPPALSPQSDQSFSSNSESSSESLYSTAMRLERMVATSFPTGSRLASCSRCSCTFFSWIPGDTIYGLEFNPFASFKLKKNKLISLLDVFVSLLTLRINTQFWKFERRKTWEIEVSCFMEQKKRMVTPSCNILYSKVTR